MLSIIIPTKNEEMFLPRLLESLKKQNIQDFEVIVADANSADNTRQVAKSFGARVVDGGLPGVGRNRGAKAAKGKHFLFLDADVILPEFFLEVNYALFRWKQYGCATTLVKPLSTKVHDRLIHEAWNMGYRVCARVQPAAAGFNLFVTRELFEELDGFDESMHCKEDLDFVKRAGEEQPFGVLPVPVHVSVRRLEKEGRIGFCVKGVVGFTQLVLGKEHWNLFDHEFGHEEYVAEEEKELVQKR